MSKNNQNKKTAKDEIPLNSPVKFSRPDAPKEPEDQLLDVESKTQTEKLHLLQSQIVNQQKELKKITEKLAETEKKHAYLSSFLPVYNLNFPEEEFENQEKPNNSGLEPGNSNSRNISDLLKIVHPDDQTEFKNRILEMRNLADGEVLEFDYRIRNIEGHFSCIRARNMPYQRSENGSLNQILSIEQDITVWKLTEKDLRFKTQVITNLQENLPIVLSTIQPDGTFESMSGSGIKSLEKEGIPNLQGQNIFELFPDLKSNLEAVFLEGKKVSYQRCVGPELATCFQNYVFLDKELNRAISFSIDVSEQIMAEKSIMAEQEFSQSLLDNSVDGILAFDFGLRLTAWNKVMEQISNIPKEKVLGNEIFELFPEILDTEVGKALPKVLAGEKIVIRDLQVDNKEGIYVAYFNPLANDDGQVTGGLCILHDVRHQKKLEEESTRLKLEQQKEILNAVLSTQEEERRRIAESLHNGVGQLLYAAKLNLQRNNLQSSENLKLQSELLDEAIKETRTISYELMPRILEDFGLETALQELLKRIQNTDVQFSIFTNGLVRFPENIEIAVYRIIQELINNILKHAEATFASLEIIFRNKTLYLVVKDNGKGFDLNSEGQKTKGIGLISIRNRIKLLDGKIEIDSAPKKGTTISIEVNPA